MTLEEFTKIVSEACQKAHLFVGGLGGSVERVRSAALRIDDDGVLSIVLYPDRMKNRVPTDESEKVAIALKNIADIIDREPDLKDNFQDFDGFFVHWDEITAALQGAGDDYIDYDQSPMELITRLINERDELKTSVDDLKQIATEA